jgi:hypothetical protein
MVASAQLVIAMHEASLSRQQGTPLPPLEEKHAKDDFYASMYRPLMA